MWENAYDLVTQDVFVKLKICVTITSPHVTINQWEKTPDLQDYPLGLDWQPALTAYPASKHCINQDILLEELACL